MYLGRAVYCGCPRILCLDEPRSDADAREAKEYDRAGVDDKPAEGILALECLLAGLSSRCKLPK